jgi:hypothetical protein
VSVSAQWQAAVQAVSGEFAALPPQARQRLTELLAAIRSAKTTVAALAAAANAEAACATCGGLCCGHGRHHFTVVDLLAFLDAGRALFTPDFAAPLCPYLDGSSCVMEPGFRPRNCVIFICDAIDDRLPLAARQGLLAAEQELRQLYGDLERLFNNRFANGLLITYERALATGRGTLLNLPKQGAL